MKNRPAAFLGLFFMPKRIDKAEELHYNRSKKNDKGGRDVFLG